MKVLFFGDIVAKLGRRALAQVLPGWIREHQPDAVVGNVENLAHGNGFTTATLEELRSLGFQGFTLGDHAFQQPESLQLVEDRSWLIARPANFPPGVPGRGYFRLPVGGRELVVVNLVGRVFMDDQYDCPFRAVDRILEEVGQGSDVGGILVDVHAEATSEKVALGWYLDGRVSAVVGTHTHVPTADEQLLPQGTAYLSDVGMTGGRDGVIGVERDIVIKRFLTQLPAKFEPQVSGRAVVQAALVELDDPRRAKGISRLVTQVTI